VLIRDWDDRWLVFWIGPEVVRLRGRYPLIGGGKADIDLPPKDRGEPASEELLDAVGFGPEIPGAGENRARDASAARQDVELRLRREAGGRRRWGADRLPVLGDAQGLPGGCGLGKS
jgi:hypothetical protein